MIYVGSARHDEFGKYSGGKLGDNLQVDNINDLSGEVSMQKMYTHSKGWYILRAKDSKIADKLAKAMIEYCNDKNVGYDQGNRLAIMSYRGISPTECDCSSLVRRCVIDATGKDPGNFITSDEVTKLLATKLFEKLDYVSNEKTPVYDGDILVTRTKGHTVIVVSGSPRKVTINIPSSNDKYPKYTGASNSIVDALKSLGEKDTSLDFRRKLAVKNGIPTANTYNMNILLLSKLKAGLLMRV